MNKPDLRERFSYWFDNKMSNGSLGLIRLLAVGSLIIVLAIAVLIAVLGLNDGDGFLSAFWDSLATIINAWMPYHEDGGAGYLILTAVAAVAGLLVTSILIGIIASAIEEKVNDLKHGSSRVLEAGHIVVLGFYPGEFTLIRQLVLSAGDEPCCIVVAGEEEQEEMAQSIRDNVDVPKNVRLICRSVDLFDPVALEKCAVSACRSVVVSPTDDYRTTKILLAVSSITENTENSDIRVSAVISREEYRFPASMAEKHHVYMLQSGEILARIIAHSCTQPGLSDTFREMFQFEGSELYAETIAGSAGLRFGDIVLRMDGGTPVGIVRGGQIMIDPPGDTAVRAGDRILLFAEDEGIAALTGAAAGSAGAGEASRGTPASAGGTVAIIGGNDSLPIILRELPAGITKVIIAAGAMRYKDETMRIADERGGFAVSFFHTDIRSESALTELAGRADHIVVLSDRDKDEDAADMESIFLLLHLRDIRERCGLAFNITAEMRREHNQKLMTTGDDTDFVVASNMSSLILAQLAECPELFGVFAELLSNEGSEIYLRKVPPMPDGARRTIAQLRSEALAQGRLVIGYRKAGSAGSVLNPPLDDVPDLGSTDSLIVIEES